MKTLLSGILLSFVLSAFLCILLIPVLRKIKAGQNILVYVKEHKNKSGTPTMGGLAFITAVFIVSVLLINSKDRATILTLVVGLAFTLVGFLDDLLKRKHKENLGLRAYQKFSFQALIAVFVGIYCFRVGLTSVYIPFTYKTLELGWGIIPLIVFTFLATVNAVNLTDGLDGLASLVSIPFFSVLGIIICLQTGDGNPLSIISFCIVGGLIAYLLFNVSPASLFMGDTGSLGLGGFAACVCVFSGNVFYIPIVGIMFVFSVISVILQVIYYKASGGKRIFLMSPLHHHFQKKGYSESKISYAYFTVTFILGCVCILFLV